ncbi:hypothetical protein T492DRAFT_978586 [Pavlovales sp. CCMP2436]|nr:hypothetical protein T492DRAFT_978586 [Pavlovales sp. CCMP2436]|mmetsp:Transcript_38378/g.95051  ORF Transcript_38378/g.95051 Transcript_38378/m.95051 type:complete len:131 (+) Transcript_38378:52-444(+)
MLRSFILLCLVAMASCFSAPALRVSRVAKTQVSMGPQLPRYAAPLALGASLAILAIVEPTFAAEFVKSVPQGGNQVAEFILPASAKASAQGIIGPPGAIFAAFVGLYTFATIGAAPWKDGLPGRKMGGKD